MKRTRRRLLGCALTAVCLGGALMSSGCGSAGAGHTRTLGLSSSDLTSEFFIAVADGFKSYAKAHGYNVIVESANDDNSIQINQVQDLITRQVSAIAFEPAGGGAPEAPVVAANRAHVPIIAIDREPSTSSKLVTFIASNSVLAAEQVCDYMFAQFGDRGEIAQIQGQLGTTPEQQRAQGCAEALKAHPAVTTAAEQAADWDENQGFTVAQNIFAAHRDLAGVFAHSDAMALGVAKAAQAGHLTRLKIVGVDGFPQMFTAIKEGTTTATEAQQPFHMGELAAQDAILAIHGQTRGIPRVQYQKTYLVTREDVDRLARLDLYGPLGP